MTSIDVPMPAWVRADAADRVYECRKCGTQRAAYFPCTMRDLADRLQVFAAVHQLCKDVPGGAL